MASKGRQTAPPYTKMESSVPPAVPQRPHSSIEVLTSGSVPPEPRIEVEEHEVDVTKVSDGCLKALFKNTKRLGIVIFKLVLGELLMYLLLYYAFNVLYRFVFAPEDPFSDDFDSKVKMAKANNEEEDFMTRLVSHFAHNIGAFTKILTFLLGFFVSTISKRWWDQVKLVPNPMSLAIRANGIMVPGEKALEVKKNILRYAMASWLLCLRPISKCLKKEYPDWNSVERTELLTPEEIAKLKIGENAETWIRPLNWATNATKNAKQQKLVDGNAKEILKEICAFTHKLEGVHEHAENPLPFVYKTMVSFVVYIYIVLSALAEQDIGKTHVDLYFPIFGFLKVFIFATWLKVALAMQNPIKDDLPLNKSFEEFREGYEMLLKDDLDLDKLNESS